MNNIFAPLGGPKKFWLIKHAESRLEVIKTASRRHNVTRRLRHGYGHANCCYVINNIFLLENVRVH